MEEISRGGGLTPKNEADARDEGEQLPLRSEEASQAAGGGEQKNDPAGHEVEVRLGRRVWEVRCNLSFIVLCN